MTHSNSRPSFVLCQRRAKFFCPAVSQLGASKGGMDSVTKQKIFTHWGKKLSLIVELDFDTAEKEML